MIIVFPLVLMVDLRHGRVVVDKSFCHKPMNYQRVPLASDCRIHHFVALVISALLKDSGFVVGHLAIFVVHRPVD
ncbi:hypothetical protein D3C78_1801370 [compost metagenome]